MEYTVNIPEWQLKEIEDTLRMVSKFFNSSKKETCLDRCVVKSQEFVKQALAARVPSSPVMSKEEFYNSLTPTEINLAKKAPLRLAYQKYLEGCSQINK